MISLQKSSVSISLSAGRPDRGYIILSHAHKTNMVIAALFYVTLFPGIFFTLSLSLPSLSILNPVAMSMTGTRVLAAFALFILTMIAGALPPVLFHAWRKRRRASGTYRNSVHTITWFNYNHIMKMLMFFGGGILLATCFIHLLPEVRENLHHYEERREALANESDKSHNPDDNIDHVDDHADHEHEYHDHDSGHGHANDHGGGEHHHHSHGLPLVELSLCVGFFVIYLLEEIVHTLIGHHDHGGHEDHAAVAAVEKEASYACYTVENDIVEETSFRSKGNANRALTLSSRSSDASVCDFLFCQLFVPIVMLLSILGSKGAWLEDQYCS